MAPLPVTHYIPAFTLRGPYETELSLCHAWVHPRTFSTEPTCLECQRQLTITAEALFGSASAASH